MRTRRVWKSQRKKTTIACVTQGIKSSWTTFFQKITNVQMSCIYLEVYFLPQNKKYTPPPPPHPECPAVVCSRLLEIQFCHRLQESLLPLLSRQLQHFLWVTGVQLRLSDRLYLRRERERLRKPWVHHTLTHRVGIGLTAICLFSDSPRLWWMSERTLREESR